MRKFFVRCLAALCLALTLPVLAAAGVINPPGTTIPATCTAGPTQASILACRSQLLATGGVILLPAGAITLTSSLPVDSHVQYMGAGRSGTPQSSDPGDNWNVGAQGTTLSCATTTFPAFAGKNTPLGTPDDGTTAIYDWGLDNVTISGCSDGWVIGATNSFGLFHSHIKNVRITGATDWGFKFDGAWGFLDLQEIYVFRPANCGLFENGMPTATYNPANTYIRRLFCIPQVQNMVRGFVFESNNGGQMGSIEAHQIQVNDFANGLITQAATMSNGSTSIGVTDGTKFAAGMPVIVDATANGFTGNQIYVVLSVSGNTVTLANGRNGSAISATGNTALNIKTYGFPALEVVALQANGASAIGGISFYDLDLEGRQSCTIYLENASDVFMQAPINPTAFAHICARTASRMQVIGNNSTLIFDNDGTSSGPLFIGTRGTPIQRQGQFLGADSTRGTTALNLSAAVVGGVPDIESRPLSGGPFLGLGAPIGQRRADQTGTSGTLSPSSAGIMVYNGSTDGTFSLPLLTDATPATSNMGLPYWVMNQGTHLLTLNTQSSQTFNGIAGLTSVIVPQGRLVMLWGSKNSSGTLQWDMTPDPLAYTSAPTLGAGCGTGATITGNNRNGTISAGTGPGSCVASWTVTLPQGPHCNVTDEAGAVPVYSESTTALTFTATASHVYDYACAA